MTDPEFAGLAKDSQPHQSSPRRTSSRNSYGPTMLVGLGGAVLAAVAGTSEWARASGDAAGIKVRAVAEGSQAAPLVTALALVVLATWGVILVARGWARRLVAVVGAVAAAGVVAAVVTAFDRAQDVALDAVADKGAAGDVVTVSLTGWYYAAGVGAVLALLAGIVAVAKVRSWPTMGTKYDAPGARAAEPLTEQDMWRALDEGHDPTS